MQSVAQDDFLEIPKLLERSIPHARVNWMWWAAGLFLLVLLASSLASGRFPGAAPAIDVLSVMAGFAVMAGFSALAVYAIRQVRAEHQRVEQIGDMIRLGRFRDAALSLDGYLSRPARSHQLRAQALIYLASVLSRLDRFADAIAVQDHLLDEGLVDPGTAVGLRLGRAMAMLREDHLFDADRAINELRRGPGTVSAGLALVEIYRDVKTGHPTEAIELFDKKRVELRDQLGARVADAHVLTARAYDLLGKSADAQSAFARATLLAPMGELFRRYPEVRKLAERYRPSPAPAEAA